MKLLLIFDKEIEISPEKICVHVGHSNRAITKASLYFFEDKETQSKWSENNYKNVLIRDKINKDLISKFAKYINYKIYDAGLDGVFESGTVLGYAVLVPKEDETFKRLRLLKF